MQFRSRRATFLGAVSALLAGLMVAGPVPAAHASRPVAVEITGCVRDGSFVSEMTDFGTHTSDGSYVIRLFGRRDQASGAADPIDLAPHEGMRLRIKGYLSPGDRMTTSPDGIEVIGPCDGT